MLLTILAISAVYLIFSAFIFLHIKLVYGSSERKQLQAWRIRKRCPIQIVVRKIDRWILPAMFITYNLNFIDKTILSNASVFGLSDDTHLEGGQYSWVSSMFYFGYLIWSYPTTLLIQKLPVGKYVALDVIVWGAIVAATAGTTNFSSLMIVRFFLGVVESTISPAFVHITSLWYTRDEIPSRTGVWFAGNSLGGLIASLLAYGIGHIEHPLVLWKWLFIIFGVVTTLWGFILFWILPDSPASARFLTQKEKQLAEERVATAGTGVRNVPLTTWKLNQVYECLLDPKTWFFFAISFLTQIPNGGTQNFSNLVIKGFGFKSLQSTLVSIPSSVISIVVILVSGWAAGNYKNITTYLLVAVLIPAVVGSAVIYSTHNKAGRLFSYYILSFGPAALPLALSLVNNNYKGITKKMTMTALLFMAYCVGNIAGPHFFLESEAPSYSTAFRAIVICYCLVIGFALGLRVYLGYVNQQRDSQEEVREGGTHEKVLSDTEDDTTDLKTWGFRYRY